MEGALAARAFVPVLVDAQGDWLACGRAGVLVDGRMAKRNLGTRLDQAPMVIGMGPGFAAGVDVHAVVETQRGPSLGAVWWRGQAEADTGRPSAVRGETDRRVLRAFTDQLAVALENFKTKFGAYPPSRVVLCESEAFYHVGNNVLQPFLSPLHEDSFAWLSRMFPRINWSSPNPTGTPPNVLCSCTGMKSVSAPPGI